MKYFAACSSAQKDDRELKAAILKNPKRVLLSYFYESEPENIQRLLAQGVDVFIDSGAFSAYNSGKNIDIHAYSKFLVECKATTYAGLDVIGDARATLKNQEIMESEYGLKPIPAFHLGSNIKDLEELLKYNYIAFGGLVFSAGIENHLNEAWRFLLQNKPQIKVHGFGVTNLKIVEKYPWYSVDSSSFKGCRRFGRQALHSTGVNFETSSEDDFLKLLSEGYLYNAEELKTNNQMRWYLEDLFALNSIKTYVDIVTEIHKYKDFSFLTNQNSLF